MISAVVGINWGDEGKGRMVDLLSAEYDVVARYQGGNNAGHTVVNDKGKFILNLLPSGVLREKTINVMGCGMVIDLEHLCGEISALKDKNIHLTPKNLKISDRASICFPFHRLLDVLEEERLADKKFGSTRRGISPAYSDKYMKKSIRMNDLLYPDTLRQKVTDILTWKNLTVEKAYANAPLSVDETMKWLSNFGDPLKQYICDTGEFFTENSNLNILFEAQLGALRDIDMGIYPYTTASTALAAYAPIGAGAPWLKIDETIGIMKAYSSCVGEGPFTAEMFGNEVDLLRSAGAEYGAATGRPRRVGGFDVPASLYGVKTQGATYLALTKLDVLCCFDKIPVCTAYDINGEKTTKFPIGDKLLAAKPIIEYFDGFNSTPDQLAKCKKPSDLPTTALAYVQYIEKTVGAPIKYVSVGAERDSYIKMF